MAEDKTLLQQIAANLKAMHRPGECAALGREALKDIQNTFSMAAWGHAAAISEPGAPLAPTQFMVNQEFLGNPLTPGGKEPEKQHKEKGGIEL